MHVVRFPDKQTHFLSNLAVTINPDNRDVFIFDNERGVLSHLQPDGTYLMLDTLTFSKSDDYHFMEYSTFDGSLYFWESGVGEVYRYDISNKSLASISSTKVDGLMYAHGGSFDDKGHIYVQGGYGFWERRNLLLRFEPDRQEWFLESADFPVDHRFSAPHILWYHSADQGLYYFSRPDDEYYLSAFYNLKDKKWTHLKKYSADKRLDYMEHLFSRSSYSTDTENGITHLYGDILMDLTNKQLLQLSTDKDRFMIFGMFYSDMDEKWMIYGWDKEISETNLKFWLVSAEELTFTEIDLPVLLFGGVRLNQFVLTLLFLSVVIIMGYGIVTKRWNESHQSDIAPDAPIRINTKDEQIQVWAMNTEVPVTDEFARNTWNLIAQMKEAGRSVISLREFDNFVIKGDRSDSFYTKKRKQILNELNGQADGEFIITVPNPLDKRSKDIRIDLSRIKVE